MRHPVRNRLLMLLYALASLCAAAGLIGIVIGKITPDMISAAYAQVKTLPGNTIRIVLVIAAVILVLFALGMLGAMFPPKKKRSSNFAIQQNENGMVRISLKAIDALVQKCLNQHAELKVITSSLFSNEETVRVDVHIALQSDISMPLAISALQKQIKKYVEACSGVNVQEVRVFVDNTLPADADVMHSPYAIPVALLGVTEQEALPVADEQEAPAYEAAIPVQEEAPVVIEETAEEETDEEEASAILVQEETAAQEEEEQEGEAQ